LVVQADQNDLAHWIVFVVCRIHHCAAGRRIGETRPGPALRRVPGEPRQIGELDVEREYTVGREVCSDTLQTCGDLAAGVEMLEHIERGDREREAAADGERPEV